MSFSKAKIQRFNDITACGPSATAYKVSAKDKIKSYVRSHSTHIEQRSPTVSESGSAQSVPCRFRTPTLPKRKKTTTSIITKAKQLIENDSEALKEKIVECENKDAFIKNLSEEIEELKNKMSKLEEQKVELDLQAKGMQECILNLQSKNESEIEELKQKFKEDMSKVNEEKMKVSAEIVAVKKQYEDVKEANRREMQELKDNCDKFYVLYNNSVEESKKIIEAKSEILKNKECELNALEDKCTQMQQKHSMEIVKLKKEHQTEIQNIEFELLKTMTELQKQKEEASSRIKSVEIAMEKTINNLQNKYQGEREQLLVEYEDKINQIVIQMKNIHEQDLNEKLSEMEAEWLKKLETQQQQSDSILKEHQTFREYDIIQCELEKKDIEMKLTDKIKKMENEMLQYSKIVSSYEELKIKYNQLQSEFVTSAELKISNETLVNTLHLKNVELKNYMEENRTYLITIKNSQSTIEVLKNRLINSDRDVEQLKKEVSESEEKLLEYENKCIQLSSDLKYAQEYNEELELQHESAIKLNTSEIQQLKAELLEKVENYHKEVEILNKKLMENEQIKKEIMDQLHEDHIVISKLKMEIECFEAINNQYEFEMEQSQNELEDYRIREMDWATCKEKLEHNVNELENILDIKQDEVNDFKKQVAQLQEKCESYFHHSEYYKSKMLEYEKELEETGDINKKYIEQSGKYDELLQQYEQLEKENLENQKEVVKLSKNCKEKDNCIEKCNQEKEACSSLLRKYEQLEIENSYNKKKADEQKLLKDRLHQSEHDRDVLVERIQYLEEELKEVSDKYADLAGHNNNKQKIKHLVDLKSKNEELIQTNMDLEIKLKSQQKVMEKLKNENSDLKKLARKTKLHPEDKENIGSPNRSLNTSRVESPFRERN